MSKRIVIFCTVFFLITHNTSHAEYVSFGYEGAIGPDAWGKLNPRNEACSKGSMQSPINIQTENIVLNKTMGPLLPKYNPTNATFDDNRFNVAVRWGGDVGSLEVDGKKFFLKQMHWHTPSEHTLNGVRHPVELHLVHRSEDNQVAVVAAHFTYGQPDSFLLEVDAGLKELAAAAKAGNQDAHIAMGVIKLRLLHSNHSAYYRYMGSLTTPPCSENVVWNILTKVRTISREQVAELWAPLTEEYHRNRRPIQPMNGRIVQKFAEEDDH